MSFKFIVNRIPTLSIEFEADSIEAGIEILANADSVIGDFYAKHAVETTIETSTEVNADLASTGKRRGRRSNAEIAAAAAQEAAKAVAPAPIPVPTTERAPIDTTEKRNDGIPAFVDRRDPPAPPPIAPNAPPVVPTAPPPPLAPLPTPGAPPVNTLGQKLVAHLRKNYESQPDGGMSMANWLAAAKVVAAGASFAEAMAVLQFTDDAALKPIAEALGIA